MKNSTNTVSLTADQMNTTGKDVRPSILKRANEYDLVGKKRKATSVKENVEASNKLAYDGRAAYIEMDENAALRKSKKRKAELDKLKKEQARQAKFKSKKR